MMPTHADFIAAVLSCVGTPIAHLGRQPGRALDCVGLPWAACVLCGMEMAPTISYGYTPSADDLERGLSQFCDPVEAGGHIWQVPFGRQMRHVVVPVGANSCGQPIVVHAWAKGRCVRRVVWPDSTFRRWAIRGVV